MDFDLAFDRLMDQEGGYSNDPNDPGGETNWGISKRSYPHLDIRNMTRDMARAIYRRDFWDEVHGPELYDGVAWQLLDFAVNSGIGNAIRGLQRALGVVPDGLWGPISQQAARDMPESDQIMRLIAERLDFMRARKNWPAHGKGWVGRMARNLRYGAEDS